MPFPRMAAWSCRCRRFHCGLFKRVATNSFFQLTICLGHAFVLAEMFSLTIAGMR